LTIERNRASGTVASLLKAVTEPLSTGHDIEWIDVCSLHMKYCTACIACRKKSSLFIQNHDRVIRFNSRAWPGDFQSRSLWMVVWRVSKSGGTGF